MEPVSFISRIHLGYTKRFLDFWRTQSRNYKLLLFSDSLELLLISLTRQYTSIYMTKLGASTLDISTLNSAASFVRMVLAIPAGLLIDRIKNIKRLYIVSRLSLLPVSLIKGLAQSFQQFFTVSIWETIGMRVDMPTWNIINISAMSNVDRIKGMVTRKMAIAILGIITPIFAAYMINLFGGLENVDSYRPLFIIQFIGGLIIFLAMVFKMEDPEITRKGPDQSILTGFSDMFRDVPGIKWALFMQVVMFFFFGLRMALMGLYFYEIKGADAIILGLMSTAGTATTLVLSVPMSRIIDKVGRLRMAYLAQIVFACSVMVPILTPVSTPLFLPLYNLISAIGSTMNVGWEAFMQEYIPLEYRGRYSGLSTTVAALIGIPAPLIGSMLWDLNPDYLWWSAVIWYGIIAIPLMYLIPKKEIKSNSIFVE